MEYKSIDEFYKACGDAIRNKKNNSEQVEKKNIPEEILSIPTNEALVVNSLDESLLIKENVGKLYECKGKLYTIVEDIPTDLTGYDISVPSYWVANYAFGKFFIDGSLSVNNSESFFDYSELCIGFEYNFDLNAVVPSHLGNLSFFNSNMAGHILNYTNEFFIRVNGGDDVTNQQLIQWFVDNNATFNGKFAYKFEEITNGKPIVVETLDESLLTEENEGKVYKLGDKLYKIKKSKIITNLRGTTFEFNKDLKPFDFLDIEDEGYNPEGHCLVKYNNEYYEPYFSFWKSTNSVSPYSLLFERDDGSMPQIIYDTVPFYNLPSGWSFGGTSAEPPIISEFDLPDLNQNIRFIKWLENNTKYINNATYVDGYAFEEIVDLEPIEVLELDNDLLISENEGKIYKCNGNLYKIIFELGKGNLVNLGLASYTIFDSFKAPAGYGKFNVGVVLEDGRITSSSDLLCIGYNLDTNTNNLIEEEDTIFIKGTKYNVAIKPNSEDFIDFVIFEGDLENKDLIKWVTNNSRIFKMNSRFTNYTFKEIPSNTPKVIYTDSDAEGNIFLPELLTKENVGKIFEINDELYTVLITDVGKPYYGFTEFNGGWDINGIQKFDAIVRVPMQDENEDEWGENEHPDVPAPPYPGDYNCKITIDYNYMTIVYENGQVFTPYRDEYFKLFIIFGAKPSYKQNKFIKWLEENKFISRPYEYELTKLCPEPNGMFQIPITEVEPGDYDIKDYSILRVLGDE